MIHPPPLFQILAVDTIQRVAFGANDIRFPLGIATQTNQLQTQHHREEEYSPHRNRIDQNLKKHPRRSNENHSKLLPQNHNPNSLKINAKEHPTAK